MQLRSIIQNLKNYHKLYEIILIPLVFSILPILFRDKESYCGFVILVMVSYWVTECLPLAITGLLPIILFPMLGILSSKETTQIYFNDTQMLFFGGLIMAAAIEKTGLHQKMALKIIMFFGSDPKWLMLGIMYVTGFLSLWISNTAATALMLPIVTALVKKVAIYNPTYNQNVQSRMTVFFTGHRIGDSTQIQNINVADSEKAGINAIAVSNEADTNAHYNESEEEKLPDTYAAKKLMKCFVLSIAYSANTGGVGTLVGTAPNLVFKSFYSLNYPDSNKLTFLTYMEYSLPVAIIMIAFIWLALIAIWLPRKAIMCEPISFFKDLFKKNKITVQDPLQSVIRRKYLELGPLTWEQGCVAILFSFLVILWVTRDFGDDVGGWSNIFFEKKFITDTTPVIFCIVLAFMCPKENPFKRPYKSLMNMSIIESDFPWGVILLGGGSLSMAEGFTKSGLSKSIGNVLGKVVPENNLASLILIILFATTGTEFTSNTSMASIFIPIANQLAVDNQIDPLYFLLPLTLSVSLAYVLPIATTPNTLIFSGGHVQIIDMVKSGLALKVIAIFVLMFSTLWLNPIFQISETVTSINNATSTTTICPQSCVCPTTVASF